MTFMFACKNAKKYQAKFAPRCNNGEPCLVCAQKWERAQKAAKAAKSKRPK